MDDDELYALGGPYCHATINEDCDCALDEDHEGDHECTCGCTWENGNG